MKSPEINTQDNTKLLMANQEFEHDPRLAELRRWVKTDLPKLNKRVLDKQLLYEDFRRIVANLLSNFPIEADFTMGQARSALQYLGFIMSSMERHSQDLKNEPGAAVVSLGPEINLLLQKLEKIAQHPPRDSVYSWCVWNRSADVDGSLTFTGDHQELLFIDIVNESFFAGDEAAELIRQVAMSEEPVGSETRLRHSQRHIHQKAHRHTLHRNFSDYYIGVL